MNKPPPVEALELLVNTSHNSLQLTRIAQQLPEPLAGKLDEFLTRVAHCFDGRVPTEDEIMIGDIKEVRPSKDEARRLFAEVYVALQDSSDRLFIKTLADKMGIALQQRVDDPHQGGWEL